ncbi:MAG: D-alanyl-D-alanine carboxypeptidase family protein [Lachnospiraceae bacterium]
MRRRKTGWVWTAWMMAAILFLGAGTDSTGSPFVPANQTVEEEAKKQEPAQKQEPDLGLHSQSAVLMDGKTGRVLYGKEEKLQRPMASTTKIMTCILALEKGDLGDLVKVSGNAASQPKVHMGMKEGETYYLEDLLYALMLESYNDAAVAIAEHIGTTVEGFADMMNEKAKSLGCRQTCFITPNGLDAKEEGEDGKTKIHSTTAEDLARIMAYCVLESPEKENFLKITKTRNYSFSDTQKTKQIACVNHNAFLDMDKDLLSGKTGFTGGAGYSYVAAEETDGRLFTIALLGCGWPPDKTWKWADARKLFEYGKENFFYRDVYQKTKLPEIPVKEGIPQSSNLTETAAVSLFSEGKEEFQVLLKEGEEVEITLGLPQTLSAPIEEGMQVGEILYTLNGKIIRKDPVRTAHSVKKITPFWCFLWVLGQYIL